MREETKLLEAILLAASAPLSKQKLFKYFPDLPDLVTELQKELDLHGIQVVELGGDLELVTREQLASSLKEFFKLEEEELSASLLEVVSIVAYAGPISRPEIDRIRGINSIYALKRLLLVGLIEKSLQSQKKNIVLYQASGELLKYLGLTTTESLPDYFELRKKIRHE